MNKYVITLKTIKSDCGKDLFLKMETMREKSNYSTGNKWITTNNFFLFDGKDHFSLSAQEASVLLGVENNTNNSSSEWTNIND